MVSESKQTEQLTERAWQALANVCDPEMPTVTIHELGLLREVRVDGQRHVHVTITPSYAGCPAINIIDAHIREALNAVGLVDNTVQVQLSPAWSSDWISASGKAKLLAQGIAPPSHLAIQGVALPPQCPRCRSRHTECLSQFGATACKALYRCRTCLEPFDAFKTL